MHQFFQFNGVQQPQQQIATTTPQLQNNETVLEICNNWEFVKELFYKMMSGELKEVGPMETTWISYINSNGIDIRNYKDAEDFEEKHIKALVAEEIKE